MRQLALSRQLGRDDARRMHPLRPCLVLLVPSLGCLLAAAEPAPAERGLLGDLAAFLALDRELTAPGHTAVDPSKAGERTRFHGYFRAGTGVNQDGGTMQRFLDSRIGRLGNEDDLYGEVAISHDIAYEGEKRWFATLRAAISGEGAQTGASTANGELSLSLPEAFVGGEDLFGHAETVWAGRRFYRRRDVSITDFYYQDLSGNGAGIDGWDLGSSTISVAVILNGGDMPADTTGSAYDESEGSNGGPTLTALTAGLEFSLGSLGLLAIDGVVAGSPAGTLQDEDVPLAPEQRYDALIMGGLGFRLGSTLGERARHVLALQGGLGSSDPFNLPGLPGSELTAIEGTTSERVRTPWLLRGVSDISWHSANAVLGFAGTLVGEWQDSGADGAERERRIDAVLRGVWYGSRHFGLALEPGVSWIDAPDAPAHIGKLTAALQMRVAETMATRPVLRLFATYAHWSEEAAAVGDTHADDRQGWNFGLQGEVWW